ncbi:MAG: hypothetical protein JOZ65_03695 [Chloroflexi bacterium]|nr:hypothetical protein [Chloroflexota bacterium]
MLIALPLTIVSVIGVAWRLAAGDARRQVVGVAAFALAVRLLATFVVSTIADQAHVTKVWLNDEASFFLATQALLGDPLGSSLPPGLDHLGGDGYLGVTTWLSVLGGGVADANTFRVINAALGSLVVVLSMLGARRLFGARAGLLTGVALSLWPSLVLWSATMLRDTLGGFTVVVVWWTLGRARELGWFRTLGTIGLGLVISISLRPYLGGAILGGVALWAAYPHLRRARVRYLATAAAAIVLAGAATAVAFSRQLDYAAHELVYRQTVTRIETLGRLYTDDRPQGYNQPIRPGVAVGLTDPDTGWVLGGVVQDLPNQAQARVAFTDESIRVVPVDQLLPLQSTSLPPLELFAWVGPNLLSYLGGLSQTSDPTSPVWIAIALVWDALLVLAVTVAVRRRLPASEWLFPLCIVAGTALALLTVPGAPGNADRHRATQTVPLLLVFASPLLADWARAIRFSGFAVPRASTRPATETAAASSRMRSAR